MYITMCECVCVYISMLPIYLQETINYNQLEDRANKTIQKQTIIVNSIFHFDQYPYIIILMFVCQYYLFAYCREVNLLLLHNHIQECPTKLQPSSFKIFALFKNREKQKKKKENRKKEEDKDIETNQKYI